MKEMTIEGDRRMTVKEVAETLGYTFDYLRKVVKEQFPESVVNGKETYLSEEQVTRLKKVLVPRTLDMKVQGQNATTALEMADKAREVMAWLTSETERMRAELALAVPKVESFDALQRSDQTMSITAAAKHFGLHPKTQVFPYLREMKYLTARDLPTQSAIDAAYLALREAECSDGEFRPQAVVLACQLETWRTRVVPQVKAWEMRP